MPRPLPKKISQIKPTLSNVALTSHYAVEFGGLAGNLRKHLRDRGIDSRYITESIGLLCSRAQLPGSGFATADVVGNFPGVAEKFAHTRAFTPLSLEFYVDNSYRSLKFVEHWMEFIASGSETGQDQIDERYNGYYFRMKYPIEYKCDETRIIKFEKDYKRYIEYRFFKLFPLSLDSTTVSYQGSNILKATATFQYDRYMSGQSRSIDFFLGTDSNKNPPPEGTGRGDSARGTQNDNTNDQINAALRNVNDSNTTSPRSLDNASNFNRNAVNYLNSSRTFISEYRPV